MRLRGLNPRSHTAPRDKPVCHRRTLSIPSFCPMELPSWRGRSTVNHELTEPSNMSIRARALAILSRRPTQKAPSLKQQKLAQKHDLRAVERALEVGAGFADGLATFARRGAVRPIARTEKRFYVAEATLPVDVRSRVSGRSRRSCLQCSVTGKTRLEVIWTAPRPSLHFCLDMGSSSFNSKTFLFHRYEGQVAGTVEPDVAHRRHNNYLNALFKVGLKETKHQIQIMVLASKAPFNSCGFFDALVGAATELFANFDHTWPWFVENYARLSHQMHRGSVLEHEHGTNAHMEQVWRWCESAPVFSSMGSAVKTARWYNLMDASVPRLRCGAVLEMVGAYIGAVEGWHTVHGVARLAKVAPVTPPLAPIPTSTGASSSAAAPPPAADIGGDAAPKTTMAASNAEVDKLAAKSKNLLHLASRLHGNELLRSLWLYVCHLTEPQKLEHSRTLVEMKTKVGTRNWCRDMAKQKYLGYLSVGMARLWSEEALREIGVADDDEFMAWRLAEEHSTTLLTTGLRYILNLNALDLQWLMRYSHMPPGIFFRILDASEGEEALELRAIQDAHAVLLDVERDAQNHGEINALLKLLEFPNNTWVREVFVGLDEAACLTKAPPDIMAEVHDFATCFKTSKLAEDAHNVGRDYCRHDKGGKLSANGLYHALIASSLLQDSDRVEAAHTLSSVMEAPQSLPPETFNAERGGPFSLGESFLQRLMESGPALGPSDYMAQTLIWNNFMHPPVEGRLYSCQRLWLSLLVEVAHVLFVPGRPEPLGLVAMRSRYGCVVLPVTVHKVGAFLWVELEDEAWSKWQHVRIFEPNQVQTLPMDAVPRSFAVRASGLPKSRFRNVVFRLPFRKPEPLLKDAGMEGFYSLSTPYMWKLIDTLGAAWEPPKPARELQVCMILLKHVFPAVPDGDAFFKDCLAMRRKRVGAEHPFNSKLDEEDVEALTTSAGAANADVMEIVAADRSAKAAARAESKAVAAVKAIGVAADPSGEPSRYTPKAIVGKAAALEFARTHLPPVGGCTIALNKDKAWEIKYPTTSGPKSHTCTFVDDAFMKALQTVLDWAWEQHRKQTGERCPHTFEELR